MFEKEIQESGKVFALSLVLMNIFILTAFGGLFWLIQIVLSQINQLTYDVKF